MKKYGNLVMIAAAALLALGWMQWIGSALNTSSSYQGYYELAQEKRAKQLYQLAIKYYQQALAENDNKNCIGDLASTCLEYYTDTPSFSVYWTCTGLLEDLIGTYPQVSAPYEAAAQLYRQQTDYDKIKTLYTRADTNGVKSDRLTAIRQEIAYCYTTGFEYYEACGLPCNGYYTVGNGDHWGLISTGGESVVEMNADMISPVGEGGFYVVTQEGRSFIMNLDGIRYANLDFIAQDAGVLSEGMVPIKRDGRWGYYDADGEYLFGAYEAAGTFINGLAAVKQDGAWHFIDASGADRTDQTFEDVAFTNTGSFNAAGVVVAKKDGAFRIYDMDLAPIGDFSCDDVDLLTESGFAYERGGLWGFADYQGNTILEPQFEDAKSFSNGQATVEKGGSWYFIDLQGNRLGSENFGSGSYLTGNNACVIKAEDDTQYRWIHFVG